MNYKYSDDFFTPKISTSQKVRENENYKRMEQISRRFKNIKR